MSLDRVRSAVPRKRHIHPTRARTVGRMGLRDYAANRLAKANATAKADMTKIREDWDSGAETLREDHAERMADVKAKNGERMDAARANRARVKAENAEAMAKLAADREGRRLGGWGWKRKA